MLHRVIQNNDGSPFVEFWFSVKIATSSSTRSNVALLEGIVAPWLPQFPSSLELAQLAALATLAVPVAVGLIASSACSFCARSAAEAATRVFGDSR
jgi:hypothetical protein